MLRLSAISLTCLALLAPSLPGVEFRLLAGQEFSGKLVSIKADLATWTDSRGKTKTISLETLAQISFGPNPALLPTCSAIYLPENESAPTRSISPGSNGGIAVQIGNTKLANLSLDRVVAFRRGNTMPGYLDFTTGLAAPPSGQDWLFIKKGGEIVRTKVLFSSWSAKTISFEYLGKERTMAPTRLYGVVFAAKAEKKPTEPRPHAIHFAKGGHLTGTITGADQARIRLSHRSLGILEISLKDIAKISCARHRIHNLVNLTPRSTQKNNPFDKNQVVARNQTVDGKPLSIGGRPFINGLCFIPKMTITYAVPPGCNLFTAVLGIADETNGTGAAEFKILVDGKSHFSRIIKGSDPAQPVSLKLKNAKTIALVADFGPKLHLGDHCIFAEPRLVSLPEK